MEQPRLTSDPSRDAGSWRDESQPISDATASFRLFGEAIFLRGENPAVYGGSESDNSPTPTDDCSRIFNPIPYH
ncbi:MAG: hypothetical protein J07HR59_01060 [Halorubrum sp. J07HR59]|nr:MAG: hypothetical protein J07HR59_01060 [Halorubrum sp. J07HR59]